jgi:multiple sugar transport system permease protein
VLAYGIWQSTPFAFIVFYAGLVALPRDSIDAARVDGASDWQVFRLVMVPQLAPLLIFVMLIHVMDAYRVFEPVMVLTQGAFSVSVQYLAYQILLVEQNPHKASAAAVLTVLGVSILLAPMIWRTWVDHRRERAG